VESKEDRGCQRGDPERPPPRRHRSPPGDREGQPGRGIRGDAGTAHEREERECEPNDRRVDSRSFRDAAADAAERAAR
jgi:hypothetical protein